MTNNDDNTTNSIHQLMALLRRGETLRLEKTRVSLIRWGQVVAIGPEAVKAMLIKRKEETHDPSSHRTDGGLVPRHHHRSGVPG